MWNAIWEGDAKRLAELIRKNRGFDVNNDHGVETLLHTLAVKTVDPS